MKKKITISAVLLVALLAVANITGNYNTWFGYIAGEDASGDRTTVFGAGAGAGAQDLYRTDLIGAAAGVDGYRFKDTVGIGYRALRDSMDMSNTVAIGSHALEGIGGMGETYNATWVNGHFVANPPRFDGSSWQQTQGEFYITGDSGLTNNLAPIWYDGTNLHLRGYSSGDYIDTATNYTEQVAAEFVDGTRTVGLALSARTSYFLLDGNGGDRTYDDIMGSFTNALAGQTFDLSTDEGLREAVSNIVIKLGGSIQVPSN